MKVRRIALATVVHLMLAAIMWFLTGAVALGYGFKDEPNFFESMVSAIAPFVTQILAAPAWFIYSSNEQWLKDIPSVIVLVLLVANSFLQVNIFFFVYKSLKSKFIGSTK